MKLPELSKTEYGLVGHPLGHSYSKKLFNAKGINYENFDLAELDAAALYRLLLLNPQLKGFNVTLPYKQAIIPFLDNLDEVAARAEAVNAVKVRRDADGRLLGLDGYNTDVEGFRQSVEPFVTATKPCKALILGTGGASKAVAVALDSLGVEHRFVSRGKRGADTLGYSELTKELMAEHLLIVNTTPLGTYPDTSGCAPIPYEYITAAHRCFDLVYNPAVTEFMRRCAEQGAQVKNGEEMLRRQAMAAYRIWTNKDIQLI
ncbi:MAG: shikimate dehydrogenase [Muribaculaceae bacterium]|nr:shikimate dehydrogenase [Muribaculaceae bacterium]